MLNQTDTTQSLYWAGIFSSSCRSFHFENPSCQNRHTRIQNGLLQLSSFLKNSAYSLENAESNLMRNTSFFDPKFDFDYDADIPIKSLIEKKNKPIELSGEMHYSAKASKAEYANAFIQTDISARLIDAEAKGEAEIRLFDNKQKFDPRISAEAGASVSFLNLSANANAGFGDLKTKNNANLQIGTAFVKGEAKADATGFVLDGSVGAAALKGEASCSFKVFNSTIKLTASGSLCSAEASFSAHFTNKEWQFGSSLGFIAGLGYKVEVEFDE